MLKIRLIVCVTGVALLGLAVHARTPHEGDGKGRIDDLAVGQAQLKRAFEDLCRKLAVLAGRLEQSSQEKDRDRATALRNVLREAGRRGVAGRFDALVRGLTRKGAARDLDVLAGVIRENSDLRKDLQALLVLILNDDRDRRLAERRDRAAALLAELKELRNRQARLQAQTERPGKPDEELKKDQDKLSKTTRDLLERISKPAGKGEAHPTGGEDDRQARTVREPVRAAGKEQQDAAGKLGRGDRDGAGRAQGRAISRLDEAIRRLEDVLGQVRQEERALALADLLARCKRMLQVQEEVLEGTQAIDRALRQQDGKPPLAQAARAGKLADRQDDNRKEAGAALDIVRKEGSAAAFAEVFELLGKDMDTVHGRLSRAEIDSVTLAIEADLVDTLKEAVSALEKSIRANRRESPPPPPEDGPSRKPNLVSLLQQLKMVHALQRRVNDRTALYGHSYSGEQVPSPGTASSERDKARYQRIQKELKELAGRQERIGKVMRDIGRRID
jgi:hypothetical protein